MFVAVNNKKGHPKVIDIMGVGGDTMILFGNKIIVKEDSLLGKLYLSSTEEDLLSSMVIKFKV